MRPWLPILPLAVGLLGGPQAGLAQSETDLDLDLDLDLPGDADEVLLTPDEITPELLAQTILLVPLSGATADSTGVGVLLEGFLLSQLGSLEHLRTLSLGECPLVEDISAELYYEGCPPGDELGCQFVIGEGAGVDRVVGGRVTVMEDRYRVIVTILSVDLANLEFTYALDLAEGEEDLLPRTVQLALERLRREELLAPYRALLEDEAALEAQLEAQRSAEDQRLVARMQLDVDSSQLDRAQAAADAPRRGITRAEVEEIKASEGVAREWEALGITEQQYISYRNSGLDFDVWRHRWAGHRLQILASIHGGYIGGATGLRYYGAYLLDPDLQSEVDGYAWQRVDPGSSFTLGFSAGLGILRNLDIEVGAWWARSTVEVQLFSGSSIYNASGDLIPDPENRPPPGFTAQTVNLWGGDLMLRYFFLTVPVVRPTLAAGVSWTVYPNLYNDPDIPDDVEDPAPSIRGRFPTWPRLTDVGIQVEPGVQVDLGRWFGIFLRVPISFGLSPARMQSSGDFPPPILSGAVDPGKAPFGTVRVLIGVQGRVLGLPVQPRVRGRDDVLDEDL